MSILVIGGTGKIGSQVISALGDRRDVRALARTDQSADWLRSRGVEDVAIGDLENLDDLIPLFRRVETVFLNVPSSGATLQENAITAAEVAGVRRIVKLSSEAVTLAERRRGAGVSDDEVGGRDAVLALHEDGEKRLRNSGMETVSIRATFLMTIHTLPAVRPGLSEGKLLWPGGDSTLALVDPLDVGRVAAQCMTTGSIPSTLHVTGPVALSFAHIAEHLSGLLGRRIEYVDLSPDEYIEWLTSQGGMTALAASAFSRVVAPFTARRDADITDVVQRLTGKAPNTIEEYVRRQFHEQQAGRD